MTLEEFLLALNALESAMRGEQEGLEEIRDVLNRILQAVSEKGERIITRKEDEGLGKTTQREYIASIYQTLNKLLTSSNKKLIKELIDKERQQLPKTERSKLPSPKQYVRALEEALEKVKVEVDFDAKEWAREIKLGIYLAGRIGGLDPREAAAWREKITKDLEAIGYTVHDPMGDRESKKDVRGKDLLPQAVVGKDYQAIAKSGVTLALIKDPSVGTLMEVERTQREGKPVFVIGGIDPKTGRPEEHLASKVSSFYSTAEEAVEGLKNWVREEYIKEMSKAPGERRPAITEELAKKLEEKIDKEMALAIGPLRMERERAEVLEYKARAEKELAGLEGEAGLKAFISRLREKISAYEAQLSEVSTKLADLKVAELTASLGDSLEELPGIQAEIDRYTKDQEELKRDIENLEKIATEQGYKEAVAAVEQNLALYNRLITNLDRLKRLFQEEKDYEETLKSEKLVEEAVKKIDLEGLGKLLEEHIKTKGGLTALVAAPEKSSLPEEVRDKWVSIVEEILQSLGATVVKITEDLTMEQKEALAETADLMIADFTNLGATFDLPMLAQKIWQAGKPLLSLGGFLDDIYVHPFLGIHAKSTVRTKEYEKIAAGIKEAVMKTILSEMAEEDYTGLATKLAEVDVREVEKVAEKVKKARRKRPKAEIDKSVQFVENLNKLLILLGKREVPIEEAAELLKEVIGSLEGEDLLEGPHVKSIFETLRSRGLRTGSGARAFKDLVELRDLIISLIDKLKAGGTEEVLAGAITGKILKDPSTISLRELEERRQLLRSKKREYLEPLRQLLDGIAKAIGEERAALLSRKRMTFGEALSLKMGDKVREEYTEAIRGALIALLEVNEDPTIVNWVKGELEKLNRGLTSKLALDIAGVDIADVIADPRYLVEAKGRKKASLEDFKEKIKSKEEIFVSEIAELQTQVEDQIAEELARIVKETKDSLGLEVLKQLEEDTTKEAKAKVRSPHIDFTKALRALREAAGDLFTDEIMRLLADVYSKVDPISLIAPVAKGGVEGGYHFASLYMPYGNLLHMLTSAMALTKGWEGYESTELALLKNEIAKMGSKGREALLASILALATHDISKYVTEFDPGADVPFSYDPGHGFKGAKELQKLLEEKLPNISKELIVSIVDAVMLHHLSPQALESYILHAVAKTVVDISQPEEKIKSFVKGLAEFGIKSEIVIDQLADPRYRESVLKRIDQLSKHRPSHMKHLGELSDILASADIDQLKVIKTKFENTVTQMVKAVDGLMASLTDALPPPELFFDVMEAFGVLTREDRAKIEQVSEDNQVLIQKYIMESMSFLKTPITDPIGQLAEGLAVVRTTLPEIMRQLNEGWLGTLVRYGEELKKYSVYLTELQFKSQMANLRDFLRGAALEPSGAEQFKVTPLYKYATALDLPILFDKPDETLDPVGFFLKHFGDAKILAKREIIKNLKEEFADESVIGPEGVLGLAPFRADVMKTFMLYPKLFDELIKYTIKDKELHQFFQRVKNAYSNTLNKIIREASTEEGIDVIKVLRGIEGSTTPSRHTTRLLDVTQPPFDKLIPETRGPALRKEYIYEKEVALAEYTEYLAYRNKLQSIRADFQPKMAGLREDIMDVLREFFSLYDTHSAEITQNLPLAKKYVNLLYSLARAEGAVIDSRTRVPETPVDLDIAKIDRVTKATLMSQRLAAIDMERFKPEGLPLDLEEINKFIQQIISSAGDLKILEEGIDVTDKFIEKQEKLVKFYYDQAKEMGLLISKPGEDIETKKYKQALKFEKLVSEALALPEGVIRPELADLINQIGESMARVGVASENLLERLETMIKFFHHVAASKVPGVAETEEGLFKEQMAVKRRIAFASGLLEAYKQYDKIDPSFKSILTVDEFKDLERTIETLRSHSGNYTKELIEQSKQIELMANVLKAESYARRDNIRLIKEKQKEEEKAYKSFSKSFLGRSGEGGSFTGGFGGGSIGGGGRGYQDLPFWLGGGGELGWVTRQLLWQISAPIIRITSFYNLVRQSTTAITEQEIALINLRRVYSGLDSDLYILGKNITKLAIDFGSVIDQVGKIQEMWARTGRNTAEQITELSRVALLAINTSDIKDADDAVRYLNSSIQQMGLHWSSAIDLLDSWNKTADRFPAATKDFAEAYARAGSHAKSLKMDIHELNAVISVLVERTGRSGAEVGTALRMMLSNIHRPKTLKILQDFGIDPYVTGSTTKLRPFMDVMAEMAQKFKDFDKSVSDSAENILSANKVLLASALGEARRRNFAIALLDAWDRIEEVIRESSSSVGYSAHKMELTMESLAFKGRQLRAAFHELSVSMGEAGLIHIMKKLTDTGTSLLSFFNNLNPSIRYTLSWVLLLSSTLSGLNKILSHTTGRGLSLSLAQALLGDRDLLVKLGTMYSRGIRHFGDVDEEFQEQLKIALTSTRKDEYSKILRAEKELIREKLNLAKQLSEVNLARIAVEREGIAVIGQTTISQLGEIDAIEKGLKAKQEDIASEVVRIGVKKKYVQAQMAAVAAQKLASLGITLLISGLVALVSWLLTRNRAMEEHKKKQREEIRGLEEQTRRAKELIRAQESLAEREKELLAIGSRTIGEQKELERVQRDLNSNYRELARVLPNVSNGFDQQGERIAKVTEATREAVKAMEDYIEKSLEIEAMEARRKLPDLRSKLQSAITRAEDLTKKQEFLLEKLGGRRPEDVKGEWVTIRTVMEYDLNIPNLQYDPETDEYFIETLVDLGKYFTQVQKDLGKVLEEIKNITEEISRLDATMGKWRDYKFTLSNKQLLSSIEELIKDGEGLITSMESQILNISENLDQDFRVIADAIDIVSRGLETGKTTSEKYAAAVRVLKRELTAIVQEEWRIKPPKEFKTRTEELRAIEDEVERRLKDIDWLRAWNERRMQETADNEAKILSRQLENIVLFEKRVNKVLEIIRAALMEKRSWINSLSSLTEAELEQLETDIKNLENAEQRFGTILNKIWTTYSETEAKVLEAGVRGFGGGTGDPYSRLNAAIARMDHEIRMLRADIEALDETWKNHNKNTFYIEAKTRLLRKEQELLTRAMKETKSELQILSKNKKAHIQKVRELEIRYNDLNKQYLVNINTMYELVKAIVEVSKEDHQRRIEELDMQISNLELNTKLLVAGLTEGKESFAALTLEASKYSQQSYLLNQKLVETSGRIDDLKKRLDEARKVLADTKVDSQAYSNAYDLVQYLTRELNEATKEQNNLRQSALDSQQALEGYVSSLLRSGYQKQLDNELKRIDELLEKENKRHKTWVENRRKEIELLRRGWAEEDFEKEMARLREEEAHLWEQYRRIEHDETQWAEKRRAELMHQIREKQREIETKAEQKRRDDMIQRIEDEIEAEDKKHEKFTEQQDELRKNVQKTYDDILRTIEHKTRGIVEAWRRTGFNITQLLRDLVPEIGEIGAESAEAWRKGFQLGTSAAQSQRASGEFLLAPGSSPYSYQEILKFINEIVYAKGKWQEGYEKGNTGLMTWAQEHAKQFYAKLPKELADQLSKMNYEQAVKWYRSLPRYERGGIVPDDMPIYAHKKEIVLPARYKYTLDRLSELIKIPRPSVPKGVEMTEINNNVSVDKAVNIENAYFNDEVDYRAIEVMAGKELRKRLLKRGVRLT